MQHAFVAANGVRLHYAEAGHGPLVLLLHGFPDFWYGWRRQMPALAAANFRVVAPDLRGYDRSARPADVSQYRLALLVQDVIGLIEALGERSAALVGHDWGGIIAWYAAMHHPAFVERLVILNAPHPAAYRRELRKLSSQPWRSAYAAFFQMPWIPEVALRAGRFALLRRVLGGGPARDPDDMERYLAAFSGLSALKAALDYYRAAVRYPLPECLSTAVPTLVLWGERDPFLVPALADGLERWVERVVVERLPHAGHWLHHDEPDRVNQRLIAFLRAGN